MKKVFLFLLILVVSSNALFSQSYKKEVRPTKNVILMIPDGCSIGVLSNSRWYKIYNKLGGENLAVDPYICGTVKTFSSNAPIGDSAPTTSAYMTGMPQQTGNISIYPVADPENDLIYVDPERAYQPLATVIEAAKIEKNKAIGLVATVEFPHATPADCSAHHYNRKKYAQIGSQMAYQNFDVIFGGGNSILTDDIKKHLENKDVNLIQDDYKAFKSNDSDKLWALFGDMHQVYDLDRDPDEVPSLEEMTQIALDKLSRREEGFFLMVEGSKIDWAAHANDAIGMVTEYLAFDKAVQVAIDFARKDENTTVIILPDHGNSGFTMGSTASSKGYDKKTIHEFFKDFSKFKKTSEGLEKILEKSTPDEFESIFKLHMGIDLTAEELVLLTKVHHQKANNYMEVSSTVNLSSVIVDIMKSRTPLWGFTTGGHSGEEVFLAAYHPKGDVPMGMNTNIDIFNYLYSIAGLQTPIEEMTNKIFAKHTDVFKGYKYSIDKTNADFPVLVVKQGKITLEVPAFKSVAYLNGKPFDIGSVTVFIDKNDTFYLSEVLLDIMNKR